MMGTARRRGLSYAVHIRLRDIGTYFLKREFKETGGRTYQLL